MAGFRQKANSGNGSSFRKTWAEENSGEWKKNRAKEWIWVEAVETPKPKVTSTKTTTQKKSFFTRQRLSPNKQTGSPIKARPSTSRKRRPIPARRRT